MLFGLIERGGESMNEAKRLITEFMHETARTGLNLCIVMTREYYEKFREAEIEYMKDNEIVGKIAGIMIDFDDELDQDYIFKAIRYE